jgi:DNA-directed RNA polymerase specialized sigma24 family protein
MDELRAATDPAEVLIAWEAVEELLACVPEGATKEVLRLVAAGLLPEEIAERLGLPEHEVAALAARGRVRVLTDALRPTAEDGRPTAGDGTTASA